MFLSPSLRPSPAHVLSFCLSVSLSKLKIKKIFFLNLLFSKLLTDAKLAFQNPLLLPELNLRSQSLPPAWGGPRPSVLPLWPSLPTQASMSQSRSTVMSRPQSLQRKAAEAAAPTWCERALSRMTFPRPFLPAVALWSKRLKTLQASPHYPLPKVLPHV